MNRLDGIEEFIAVAEAGSFSAAARSLNLSKAHVSQQVSRLEDRLGTRLLHRTTRKVSLTETGAIYIEHCRPIIEDLKSADLAVSNLQHQVRGRIRICSPHLLGEVILVPALTLFQEKYPDLEIDIDLSSRKIDLINERYDIAIQVGERKDTNVVNKALATTRFKVVASPSYIEKYGQPNSPAELKEHHCLLFASRGESKPWKFKGENNTVEINIKSHWRSNSGHLLRAGAKSGLGLAYLPDYYLKNDIQKGELIHVMQGWQSVDRNIVAIYQHKTHVTTKIRLFIEFLTEYIQSHSQLINYD